MSATYLLPLLISVALHSSVLLCILIISETKVFTLVIVVDEVFSVFPYSVLALQGASAGVSRDSPSLAQMWKSLLRVMRWLWVRLREGKTKGGGEQTDTGEGHTEVGVCNRRTKEI